MTKTAYITSWLQMLLGSLMLSGGLLLQMLLPKIGYFLFQLKGGYYNATSYELGWPIYGHHILAMFLIVNGAKRAAEIYGAIETHDGSSRRDE